MTNLSHRLVVQILIGHFNITGRKARSFITKRTL
jgi:hypothetical protein